MLKRSTWIALLMAATLGCAQTFTKKTNAENRSPKTKGTNEEAGQLQHVDGKRAMQYLRELVALGPRPVGSPAMAKQQAYLRAKLKGDNLEEDTFKSQTPDGEYQFTNFIAKYPGSTDDIIVIASHYDTLKSVKDFVGANDGGSSTALLLELANQLRGKKRSGPAVWLVWFDGEEAFKTWTATDSDYGSRHLSARWQKDGTLKKINAFILTDMIGDADLNIEHDTNSTPWLSQVVYQAATNLSRRSYFYGRDEGVDDDHTPFLKAGVPCVDIIDFNYGYNNVYWHTAQDTVDKLSANSLQIVGDVVLETVRLLSSGEHQK